MLVSSNGVPRDVFKELVGKAKDWVGRVKAASNDPTEQTLVKLVLAGQLGMRTDEKGERLFVLFDEEARFRFAVEYKLWEEKMS